MLGCHKAGLAVIRALGEQGVPVVAVRYSARDMGHASRHVVAKYRVPHPDASPAGFVDALLRLAARWRGSVLLPTDDATVIQASKHRNALRQHFKVVANGWPVTEKYIVKKHTYALDGRPPAPSTDFEEGVFWIDAERDVIQRLTGCRQTGTSWKEYVRPYRNGHIYAVWSRRDPMPFFRRVGHVLYRGLRHVLKRIWTRLASLAKLTAKAPIHRAKHVASG